MGGYRCVSTHPEDLASGRFVAPGDQVPQGAIDPKNPHDARLIDEGLLIEIPAAKRGKEDSQ
jgi:hypothetical protein